VLQYGIKASVFDIEPEWAKKVEWRQDYSMVSITVWYTIYLHSWKIKPLNRRIICRDARTKFSIAWSAYT
jgi:hypothetical protein